MNPWKTVLERWIVEETTKLELTSGAKLSAAEGKALSLFVNGTETVIQPGSYQGQILLQVK